MGENILDVAAKLTPAQRRALLWLPPDGWTPGPAHWTVSNTIKALEPRGMTKRRIAKHLNQSWGPKMQWRLTPLGREVRAVLAVRS